MHASLFNGLCRAVGVVCAHLHAESLGNACHVAAHVSEGQNAQALAHQLASALAVVEVAHGIYQHAHHQFGHGVAVLSGSVHSHHVVGCGSLQVQVVESGTRTHHNLQVLGSVQHLGIHLVAAHNQRVSIAHSLKQLALLCIFLKQRQFITRRFNHLSDALHRSGGKGLFRSNQYFHCTSLSPPFNIYNNVEY